MDIKAASGKNFEILKNNLLPSENSPLLFAHRFIVKPDGIYWDLSIIVELYSINGAEGSLATQTTFVLNMDNREPKTENDVAILSELTMIADANLRTAAQLLVKDIRISQLPPLRLIYQLKPQIKNIVLEFWD